MADFSGSAFLLPVEDSLYFDRLSRLLIDQYPAIELTALGDYHITAVYMPDSDGFTPALLDVAPLWVNVVDYTVWDDHGDGYPIVLLVEKTSELAALQTRLYEQALSQNMPLSPYSNPETWQPHITLGYYKGADKPTPGLDIQPIELYINAVSISDKTGEVGYLSLEHTSDDMMAIDALIEGYASHEQHKSLVAKIATKVMDYLRPFSVDFDTPTGFKVYKNDYWIAWYTNAFEDRDSEFFKQKSIERDIEYMNSTGDYPELWRWHIGDIKQGLNITRHGKAFYVDTIGKFAVAIGKFDDTPLGNQFKAYYKKHPQQALSHGFFYTKKEGDTYTEYHTFEISTLPPDVAANPYTTFLEFSEDNLMKPSERAIADLKAALGDDQANALLNTLNVAGLKATEALDKQGVAFKAMPLDMETEEDAEDDTKKTPKKKEADISSVTVDLSPVTSMMEQMMKAMTGLVERVEQIEAKQATPPPVEEKKQEPLHDARKTALIAEMQQNQQREIKARDLSGLDALHIGLLMNSKDRADMGIKGL